MNRHELHEAVREALSEDSPLNEATPEEQEELQLYHASIKQDSVDLKRNYKALKEFAHAVGSIDRKAKGGGPMVQFMRLNRLSMVKKRAGAHIDMIVKALSDI